MSNNTLLEKGDMQREYTLPIMIVLCNVSYILLLITIIYHDVKCMIYIICDFTFFYFNLIMMKIFIAYFITSLLYIT